MTEDRKTSEGVEGFQREIEAHCPDMRADDVAKFAQALTRHGESVRAEALEEAALAAKNARLPEGYQWGWDAMEQFNFGKERAELAIRALKGAA